MSDPRLRSKRRPRVVFALVAGVVLALAGGVLLASRTGGGDPAAAPVVGSDLHAVVQSGGRLFVSGHSGAAYSDSPGSWTPINTLADKDAMVWAVGSTDIVVAGHEGVFRSTDNGDTFTPLGSQPATDVHAAGSAGKTVYLASPTAGLQASADGGATWTRAGVLGESFLGNLLVDPKDTRRVVAADQLQGIVETRDGGRTWTVLGGIEGPLGLAWNPKDHQQLVTFDGHSGSYSPDDGASWLAVPLPAGAAAVSFGSAGELLIAILRGDTAALMTSTDRGTSWTARD